MAEDQNLYNELVNPIPSSYDDTKNGPLPGSNFRYETIEDLPIPDELEALDPGLDNQYVNMLNAAAPSINKYAPAAIGNINTPYPTLAGDTYDPRRQQLPPDLTTAEGISRYFNQPSQIADDLTKDIPIVEDPIYAGQKATNFARYYEHPNFNELGFHPYSNNEEYYNANSTAFDDGLRMWDQYWNLTGTGFMSGYRNLANWVSGDLEWWGTGADIQSAEEYEKAFEVGSTSREGVIPFLQNTGLNFAYTTGILGSVALEELALFGVAALQGGLNPAADAAAITRTGFNIGRVGKAISNSFTVGKMFNASRNMVSSLKNVDRARKFHTAAKTGVNFLGDVLAPNTINAFKSLKTSKNVTQNLFNISRASKVFGGVYRDFRSINLALAESNMEAGFVYNDMIGNGIAIKQQQNGGQPLSTEDMLDVQEKADRAAFATAQFNAPFIYLTNQLVLGNALGGRAFQKLLKEPVKGFPGRVLRTGSLRTATGEIVQSPFEYVGKGLRGGFKRIKAAGIKGGLRAAGGASLRMFAANVGEGAQELYQEGVQVGTQTYFTEMLKAPTSTGHDYFNVALNNAVSSQMTQQGFETFMSGFLIGGLGNTVSTAVFQGMPNLYESGALAAPFSKSAREKYSEFKAEKEKLINKYVDDLNESWNKMAEDPTALFDPNKLNLAVQNTVANSLEKDGSDTYNYIDSKDYSKFQQLYTILSTGKTGEFRSMLNDLNKLTDEELYQAYPSVGKGEGKSGKIRERIDSMIKEIDKMELRFEKLNDTYPNQFNPSQFKEGSRAYIQEVIKKKAFDHYKFLYLFTENSFNRSLERYNSIFEELSTDPIFKTLAASDFTTLLDSERLISEIQILNTEIDSLDDSEENKKIKNDKIKKQEILSEYLVKLSATIDEQTGEYDRVKMQNALAGVFEKYVKYLGNAKGEFVDTDRGGIVFEKIIDGYSLKNSSNMYYKSIEALNNPEVLNDIFDRTVKTFNDRYKNQKQIFKESIEEYIRQAEKNTYLNKLYKEGIYMTPESVQEFSKQDPNLEKIQYFTENGPVNPIDDPKAQAIVDEINSVFNQTYEKPKEKPKTEKKDDKFESKVDTKVDEEVIEETPDWTDFTIANSSKEQHPVGKKLMSEYYDKNVNIPDGTNIPTIEEWIKSDEGKKVLRAYKNVKKLWGATLQENDPKYLIDEGFEDWLKTQADDPLVYRALNQADLTLSDLTDYKKTVTMKLAPPEGAMIDIYKKAVGESEDSIIYVLRDKNGQKLKKGLLDKAGVRSQHPSLGAATDARNAIVKILNATQEYTIDDNQISYGKFVKAINGENKGEEYIVGSTTKDFNNQRFIYLVPRSEFQILGDKVLMRKNPNVKKIKPGRFKNNYQVLDVDFTVSDPNVSKINQKEPKQTYIMGEVQNKILDKVKAFLPKSELDNLQITVKKNKDGGKQTKPLSKDDGKSTPNNNIIQKKETYSIAIKLPSELPKKLSEALTPQEKKTLLELNSTGKGVFAFVRNNSYDFIINGVPAEDILNLSDEELFKFLDIKEYKKYGDSKKSGIKEFKNALAAQKAFINEIENKLGSNTEGTFSISDFKDFSFKMIGGEINFANEELKLDQLSTSTYDGNYVLMENIVDENDNIVTNVFIKPETAEELSFTESKDFKNKVIEESAEQNTNLYNNARYKRYSAIVKQPNGIISYIPLKQRLLDQGELDAIVTSIAENASVISKIKDTQEANTQAVLFSKTINEDFYISTNTPNIVVNVNLSSNGSMYIKVYDKERRVQLPGDYQFTTPEELMDIANSENKSELFKNKLQEQAEAINNAAKEKLQDPSLKPNTKNNLERDSKFAIADMLVSFPKEVTLETLLENTTTSVGKDIRKGYSLELATNSAKIQNVLDAASIKSTKEEEVVETVVEDDDVKTAESPEPSLEFIASIFGQEAQNLQAELLEVEEKLKDETLDANTRKQLNARSNKIIEQLASQANKILPFADFTAENITSIDEFSEWMVQNLPDYIGLDSIGNLSKNLKTNGVRVGAFVLSLENLAGGYNLNGTIYTSPESPYKYHEAFHAVFRMLLTPEQQSEYYKIAASEVRAKLKAEGKNLAKELEVFKNSNEKYNELGRKQLRELYLEEYMADEFEKFKANPRSTKTNSFIKTLFTKLIDIIKSILGNYNSSGLQTLYQAIDSGKFKSSSIESNYHTDQAGLGVTIDANKIIPKKKVIDFTKNVFGFEYLNTDVARTLVASIGADVLRKEKEAKGGAFDINEAIGSSIQSFAKLYDPNNSIYANKLESDKQLLSEINQSFTTFPEFIEDGVVDYLRSFDLKIETVEEGIDEFEMEYGLRNTYQYNKSADMNGGFNNLPVLLRRYIGMTTLEETDWFGNEYLENGVKLRVPVDFAKSYNGFLKAAKNTSDPSKIIQNLYFYSRNNPHTAAVMDRFFNDIGVSPEDIGTGNIDNVNDPGLYMSFIKGFENYVADYLFIHTSANDGRVVSYSAANRDDANTQFDNWSNAYFTLYNTALKNKANVNTVLGSLENLSDLFKVNKISDAELDDNLSNIISDLRRFTGISLSLNYLRNSVLRSVAKNNSEGLDETQQSFVNAYVDEGVLLQEDVAELRREIGGNIYLYSEEGTLGMPSRLKRISLENSYFDETVGASVFRNPENNFVYAHQLPSYHLKTVQSLNDSQGDGAVLETLKERNPYLELNYLLNSPFFRRMSAEDRLKILKISGTKESNAIDYQEDYSITTIDDKKGTKYGDLKPDNFLLTLINMYTATFNNAKGKVENVQTDTGKTGVAPSLVRVIEASNQSDMMYLPVIKAVTKKGKTNKVTAEARDAVVNNITSEFNRIKKELNPQTATFNGETGLIAEYNADKTGQSFNSDGKAFQFFLTGKILGGYKSIMEENLKQNPNIDLNGLIKQSGFTSQTSFLNFIERRLDEGFNEFYNIIKEQGLEDNISSYLKEGLQRKDGSVDADVIESMSLLNLRKEDVQFNLKQIFLNDYINTTAINQILLGDEAKTLNGVVDAVKRAKAQTGQGPSTSVNVTDLENDVQPLVSISAIALTDPVKISKVKGSNNNIDQADAQGYITVKAFKYFQYGTGRLQTQSQFDLIREIQNKNGLSISAEDYYGSDTKKGYDKQQAMMNSKKYFYMDGETYAKLSFFTLTPEFTSTKSSGYTEAKPNKKELHNLRVKLEQLEKESSDNTVGIAMPITALKMKKENVQNIEAVTSNDEALDSKMVNTLSPEDMRLQVINPSNKLDMSDPTQIKTLITAEQDKELSRVILEYNKAIIERQNLNVDNLDKLLTGDMSPFLNYAQASLSASQSNSQLREFFEINDDGTPKYELNNPISVKKYEQLLLNYVASRTVKEKLPGISAALVSDFGINVYRKIYSLDENGELERHEVIRDIDFEKNYSIDDIVEFDSNEQDLSVLRGLIEQSNGKGIVIVDKLRHDVKGEDGLRYTEALLPPHHKETYEISKTEAAIPDVVSKMFGIRIPSQDKHSSVNIKIVDFMPAYYGSNIVTARELVEIAGSDFDIDKLYLHTKDFYEEEGVIKEYTNTFDDYAKYVNKNISKKGSVYNEALSKLKYQKVKNRALYAKNKLLSPRSIKVLTLLGLPTTKEEYAEYAKDGKSPYDAPYNNKVLDYKLELLGNKYMSEAEGNNTPIAHQPAALKAVEDTWNTISSIPAIAKAAQEESLLDNSLLSKFYSFKANKSGAAGIGPIVKANLYLSLLMEKGASVTPAPAVKNVHYGGHLKINGQSYTSFADSKNTNGARKQDIISSLITMMTDNAKKRLADKLGLNVRNIGLVGNMVALGVPLTEAVLLINHPKIKEAYNQELTSAGSFIKRITTPTGRNVTLGMLQKAANNEQMSASENNAIFRQFLIADRITGFNSNLASVTGMVNGYGKSMIDIEDRKSKIEKLTEDRPVIKNIEGLLEGTWQWNMTQVFNKSMEVVSKNLVMSTAAFNKMANSVLETIDFPSSSVSNEVVDKVKQDLLSYLISQAYINNGQQRNANFINDLSNALLYRTGNIKTISDLFDDAKRIILDEFDESNFFFETFANKHLASDKGNRLGVDYLSANTFMRLNDSQKVDLQSSFASLYGNPNTRDIANTIINYMIVKDGMMYKTGSLMQAISPFAISSYLNQASNVAKSLESNEEEDIQYVFGKTLNELTEEFNESYLKSNVNRDIIPKVNKVKFINKGEFKGKYEILDAEVIFIPGGDKEILPFDKMYASYTFMNDVGMPNTIYLKKLTDVQDTYEQIDLDGSNGQTGIGFVFGPRPTNKQVREIINAANNTQQEPILQQPAPASEEVSPFQDKINKDLDSGGTITSDGSSISSDFTTEEGQIVLTDDLLNQMESYDYAKEEITSEDNNQAAEEFMSQYFDNNENTRAKLIDSGIRNVEDLIAKFNAANKLNTSLSFNSYIEDVIKKCGL